MARNAFPVTDYVDMFFLKLPSNSDICQKSVLNDTVGLPVDRNENFGIAQVILIAQFSFKLLRELLTRQVLLSFDQVDHGLTHAVSNEEVGLRVSIPMVALISRRYGLIAPIISGFDGEYIAALQPAVLGYG